MAKKNPETVKRNAKRAEANAKRLNNIVLFSIKEIAPILGVEGLTVLKYIRDGKIKGFIKVGREWMISEENLKKFINGEEK